MKILRIEAAGTDAALAHDVTGAIDAFNRSIDIRLRFLSIEIDETRVAVDDAETASAVVAAAVRDGRPVVSVLFGDGDVALAAAAAAVREGQRLIRVGAGRREGADADAARAVDRLSAVCLVYDEAAARALGDEGLAERVRDVGPKDEPGVGARIVSELARARRAAQGGG